MSGGVAFGGYGLRQDSAGQWQPESESVQRAGWFVFQRFVSVLSGTRSGEMVVPSGITSRATIQDFLSDDDAHPFLVFHYQGAFSVELPPDWTDTSVGAPVTETRQATFSHAWLLMRDPTVNVPISGTLYAHGACGLASGEAWIVPFGYTFMDVPVTATESSSSEQSSLPMRAVSFEELESLDLSTAVAFSLDYWDGPVLIVSEREITWTVTKTITGASVRQELGFASSDPPSSSRWSDAMDARAREVMTRLDPGTRRKRH
jgi:hypothetical protein